MTSAVFCTTEVLPGSPLNTTRSVVASITLTFMFIGGSPVSCRAAVACTPSMQVSVVSGKVSSA
ncbi:MAG TPA: hypothetical protein VHF25_03765 [Nitriliruptorales bacterium]|nr:hypothetical protein [Nitriliruptorales bacterium]